MDNITCFNNLCNCVNKYTEKNSTTAKNITVFLNGLRTEKHRVTLDSRRLNKWYHILNEITHKIDPYFGLVKKLYSSDSGVTICSFSDLENNGTYVASDSRKFQIIKGGYKNDEPKCYFEHYLSGHLRRSNRRKKLSHVRRDLLVIYVFNNGKEKIPPEKIVLSKDDLKSWEHTLSFIALVIDMPYRTIKALYDSNGCKICGPWELQHGASYIAVGYHEKFIHRNYKINESTAEYWRCGLLHVDRDKNAICSHKHKRKSWDQNLIWKHSIDNYQGYVCPTNNKQFTCQGCNRCYSLNNYDINRNKQICEDCHSGSSIVIPGLLSLVPNKHYTLQNL